MSQEDVSDDNVLLALSCRDCGRWLRAVCCLAFIAAVSKLVPQQLRPHLLLILCRMTPCF